MSTHNIYFYGKVRKLYIWIPLVSADGRNLQLAGLVAQLDAPSDWETRRSQVQPPPRSATFFRGD